MNKSVVEKVFGAIIVTELLRAYSYDLQQPSADKNSTNIMYYHDLMKDKLLTNRTVDHVWDYMHPELKDENGDHLVQEMVVMDKLAFFYTQYIVQFALIGVCGKCLPFIDNLGNQSKVKDLLPQHCALDTTKEIVLNPRYWISNVDKGKKAKNDQFTRDEYVKVLGLQFNGAIISNSVPRTFQDCMEAILYQKKKKKKKCRDSKWWDFFDLENFATLFDKHAGEAIAERKADFMISDEDSVDDSRPTFEANASDSSPKSQIHNTLLDRF